MGILRVEFCKNCDRPFYAWDRETLCRKCSNPKTKLQKFITWLFLK